MNPGFRGIQGQPQNVTLDAMKEVAKDEQQELKAEQLQSQAAFKESQQEAINPFAAQRRNEKKIESRSKDVKKSQELGEKSKRLLPIEQIKDMAGRFQQQNRELRANVLVMLREYIKPDDKADDILRKVLEFYPDVTLAEEALDFLLATTDGELARQVQEAKEKLQKEHGSEIRAGKNITEQALAASEKGLGTPTSLRDMYRDITGNPRDSTTLFEELSQRYPFKELKKVIDFLLHSLGADMKSSGPSIPRGLLHRLFTETRNLQAILGVYRFFRNRMPLVESMFAKNDLEMPPQLNFELLAKQFMSLAAERYPSSAKVKDTAVRLGIEKWLMAKIIAFSQLRDAVREVAVNQVYKSIQHRDELYMAIIEALEDLEDELEELEEQLGEKENGEEEEEEKEESENQSGEDKHGKKEIYLIDDDEE